MKIVILTFLFYSFNLVTYAQHHMGFKVNGGVSRVKSSFAFMDPSLKVLFAPSGQAGIFYTHKMNDQLSLVTELLFAQIGGKDKTEEEFISISGDYLGHGKSEFRSHLSYASLPVFLGLRFDDFQINCGWQISMLLFSSFRHQGEASFNGTFTEWDERGSMNIDLIDFGPKGAALYQLSERIAIEGNCYFGLRNIASNVAGIKWRVQQATLGLRYSIIKKPNKERKAN